MLAAANLVAQSAPPAGAPNPADTAERIQREELDRQREIRRQQAAPLPPPSRLETPLPERPAAAAGEATRDISRIDIVGADHLAPKVRAELERRYVGRMGVSQVEALLSDITRYYVLRGYVTTRAYLPPQDLSTGTLRVIVVEGRVERIAGGVPPTVFPIGRATLLDLRSLEQGIDNLNRLGSNQAALDLQPGTQPGGTIVAVKNEPTRRWHVNASLDNSGTKDTGRDQASATVTLDNPLGLADEISLNQRLSLPYESGKKASAATSASYSVPWGWYLLSANATTSSYALEFNAPSGVPLPFDGSSRSATVRLERVLERTRSGRLTAFVAVTGRSAKNYLMHSLIGVSSRDTTSLDAGLEYSTAWHGAFVSANADLVFGVPWFGGLRDAAALPSFAPRAEYAKALLGCNLSRPFSIGALRFGFNSSVSAQLSRDVLYGSDQLTIGGLYAVRGFDETNLAGDQGFVWRNDLSLNLQSQVRAGGVERSVGWRPYVGFDAGRAWSRVDVPAYAPVQGTLLGGAVGVSLTVGRANADVSYQRSVDRPSALRSEPGRILFRFSLSL